MSPNLSLSGDHVIISFSGNIFRYFLYITAMKTQYFVPYEWLLSVWNDHSRMAPVKKAQLTAEIISRRAIHIGIGVRIGFHNHCKLAWAGSFLTKLSTLSQGLYHMLWLESLILLHVGSLPCENTGWRTFIFLMATDASENKKIIPQVFNFFSPLKYIKIRRTVVIH